MSAPTVDARAVPQSRDRLTGALLRSAASEHSDVTLRAVIIDDDASTDLTSRANDRSGGQ